MGAKEFHRAGPCRPGVGKPGPHAPAPRDAKRTYFPLGYHITFGTYGTRLHRDPRGTVDRSVNNSATHHRPQR
jgi:hypothetical protein